MWDDAGTGPATLVDVAAARQTPIAPQHRTAASVGFRAFPAGAVQLWDDGRVTLFDRRGAAIQQMDEHRARVEDVAVSRDGTWSVSVGVGAEVLRWDIDPATGRWSEPEPMAGHARGVTGVEVDATGRTLVTVSQDRTVIRWDTSRDGDDSGDRGPADPATWLAEACAVVGRDLTPAEWRRYLPDRPWQPTCSDLP